MPRHPFLSDEWVAEAKRIRDEHRAEGGEPPQSVRMNQIVTDVPFGPATIDAHLDTSTGEWDLDKGHLADPDVTVTLDYATARAVLVDGDLQAAMQALVAGKVKVEGDVSKLLLLQQVQPDPGARELAERVNQRIRDITE